MVGGLASMRTTRGSSLQLTTSARSLAPLSTISASASSGAEDWAVCGAGHPGKAGEHIPHREPLTGSGGKVHRIR